MRRWLWVIIAVVGMSFGCTKVETAADTEEVPSVDLLGDFYSSIADLEINKSPDEVQEYLTSLLYDEEQAAIHEHIFHYMLHTLIRQENRAEAREQFLAWVERKPSLAGAGVDLMLHTVDTEDPEDATVWVERLIASSLPDRVQVPIWRFRVGLYLDADAMDDLAGRLEDLVAATGDRAVEVLEPMLSRALADRKLEGTGLVLDALQSMKERPENLGDMQKVLKGRWLLAKGRLVDALQHHRDHAERIGDVHLTRALRTLLNAAEQAGEHDLQEQTLEAAHAFGAQFPRTRDEVAVWFIARAVGQGNHHQFLDQTRSAFEKGVTPARFIPTFLNGFYPAVQAGDSALRRDMADFMGLVLEQPDLSTRLQSVLGAARLDVAFFEEDFKMALQIVDGGLAGYDEQWHQEVRDKVMAHLALQEERYDDAVALFAKHVERVSLWTEPMVNPETGRPVIKEVVIGLNERRIGDIWADVEGREDEARAAYARARAAYQEALLLLEEGSPEYREAAQALQALPDIP